MKKNKLDKLSDLLPDNLSEDNLNQIATLISDFINEEVSERIKLLEAKTMAFIRGNIDLLKEQAESEITEESELYRDAMQFRKLQDILGVTEVKEPEVNEEVETLKEENAILIQQINNLIPEINKYKTIAKKYKSTSVHLKEQLIPLSEQVETLLDTRRPFKSSEKALILAEEQVKDSDSGLDRSNPFLNENVMALMPKK
jgi:iron uptake system EfeUOB component EfeO/EfeM